MILSVHTPIHFGSPSVSCVTEPQPLEVSLTNALLAIPQAWDLPPTDRKTPHYKCVLEIPNSLVAMLLVIRGGTLNKPMTSLALDWPPFDWSRGCWFISIRGTNQQIGEALVVFGKHITKQYVHIPQK